MRRRTLSLAARLFSALFMLLYLGLRARAQEAPYFVTYDHHLEEPSSLEIEASTTAGSPHGGQRTFFAPYTEFEYGVTGWWTSELYVEGQTTAQDSTLFTGWRLENRFALLAHDHAVNPVLYFEYEDVNEASRITTEVTGHNQLGPDTNATARLQLDRELETKLILSGDRHGWNISWNGIVEKNFTQNEGVEFGYALGVAHSLAGLSSGANCVFCRNALALGLEAYGGLGSTQSLTLRDTAQYIAPVLAWQLSPNSTLRLSPGVGLTHVSEPLLLRIGYSYEFPGFGEALAGLLHHRGKSGLQ